MDPRKRLPEIEQQADVRLNRVGTGLEIPIDRNLDEEPCRAAEALPELHAILESGHQVEGQQTVDLEPVPVGGAAELLAQPPRDLRQAVPEHSLGGQDSCSE